MVKRMLIDATHPEETRVVVLDGTRLDEFDVESSTKKQIKGNIYLAKVVRVEPSLQAAFVEYGGNRHGFLAFSEIHPDYYQIPVADRERLLADVERHHREQDQDDHHDDGPAPHDAPVTIEHAPSSAEFAGSETPHAEDGDTLPLAFMPPAISAPPESESEHAHEHSDEHGDEVVPPPVSGQVEEIVEPPQVVETVGQAAPETPATDAPWSSDAAPSPSEAVATAENGNAGDVTPRAETKPVVETIGGEDPDDDDDEDEDEEDEEGGNQDKQRRRFLASRHYKIQEVIKRRQILLVQVVKEERGNKGAALTTYLSLAGRYCVLMPNSARGGGVSRKITSAQDRRRLKEIVGDLELPKNMAVILRTAGAERSKPEIKRDYEYLQRTWNSIREVTMQSRAPALVHEEASLIKRSIRDIYSRDIEEVWVDGEDGYKAAKDFMRVLTPSHAKRVQRYRDDIIPLFHRYQVESQIETINNPTVQLRSGGSIVFGQTEALVAIDVNSGRATRERHIEETALKTNLEAADEVARQLRLRDLAGLVVIDFIDMEDNRNNHAVERRLKEALRNDRARIQVGRISHFGLLELSRQRLRPSLIETNFKVCHHCAGTGLLRSTESAAVHALRTLEEEGAKRRSSEVTLTVNPEVALYLLNYKRDMLASVETRYAMRIFVFGDATLIAPNMRVDRVKRSDDDPLPPPRLIEAQPVVEEEEPEAEEDDDAQEESADSSERNEEGGRKNERPGEDDGARRKRRRRRRRRGGERDDRPQHAHEGENGATEPAPARNEAHSEAHSSGADGDDAEPAERAAEQGEHGDGENGDRDDVRRGRRRGRRGGRRRRRGGENGSAGPRYGEERNGEDMPAFSAEGEPFPVDHTRPANPDVHVDEAAPRGASESEAESASGNDETNGGKSPRRGFFRALKEGALGGWRRNENQPGAEQTPVEAAPAYAGPEPVPVPAPAPIFHAPPPPAVEPAPPRPAPPPEPVVRETVTVAPEEPSGPPRRGWWNQQNKTE